MKQWFMFFFGSPQRAVATLAVFGALMAVNRAAPGALREAAAGVWSELSPLLVAGLAIFFAVAGLKLIVFGPAKKKKR